MNFAAQYQQNPVPPDGNAIRREWLRYYDTAPSQLDLVMASWDTASTLSEVSDYSVGTVWGLRGSDIYLLDVVRGRLEVPELRRQIEAVALHHKVDATVVERRYRPCRDTGDAALQSRPPDPLASEIRQGSPAARASPEVGGRTGVAAAGGTLAGRLRFGAAGIPERGAR
jgi:hypothetical protein